jgi:5'-3' exonuclease
VRERYGVEPAQVPDFIALRGDPSDGLPGAPGIGAKTAAQLLRAHGTLESLLELAEHEPVRAARELRPRTRAALLDNAQALRAFKQIATLQRIDVRVPADRATDYGAGATHAEQLGMRALARRLRARASATA